MSSAFTLPVFNPPDFTTDYFRACPLIRTGVVGKEGVAPDNFHATTIFPEYYQVAKSTWALLEKTRMDCVVVQEGDTLSVREFRKLKKGNRVVLGRSADGEDGIYVHTEGFANTGERHEKFSFLSRRTRETPFSRDYDSLYALLRYEKKHGRILWILGPAITFDYDSREAMSRLIRGGYAHALCAGNALATHDIEAALFETGLGQDIYTKEYHHQGHYNHLDAINLARKCGSLSACYRKNLVKGGIISSCLKKKIPLVLAGSIRDDGPLPDVIADVYNAQDAMRSLMENVTTVIALATQLHAIAAGNMLPSYQVINNRVRPVYFYIVDISEFALDKLANRGSLHARGIVTNVQDFLINVQRALLG
jgi:lysine-ketoglutarate reductase/saccharopine dehydrogenase-like protein (TIGR00300 family)